MSRGMAGGSTKKGRRVVGVVLVILIAAAGVYFAPLLEWHAPTVAMVLEGDAVGLRPFKIKLADEGKGLKGVSVTLMVGQQAYPLFEEEYGEGVFERSVAVELKAKERGIKEGAAVMRVMAWDHSLWGYVGGNKTIVNRNVLVDVTPPRVEVVSREHYVNFGGAGVVIYKTSPDTIRSGVVIGDFYFPGVKGQFRDGDVQVVFFAHPHNVPKDARPVVLAEDRAGNRSRAGFFYRLKDRRYRKRTINVSDGFIERKVLPLLGGEAWGGDKLAAYLKANRELRAQNAAQIKAASSNPVDRQLWSGAFLQLSNSKVEAAFADERRYFYKNRQVDHQYHLGYDLAVTRQYPVEAANAGVVVFADDLGIYGNTVILDHGLGVFTLYAHLSKITVAVGDRLEKKAVLGNSGETGLAGGDHLHYGVLIHGVPVLPTEWWDPKWIRDNVSDKLEEARREYGAPLPAG